MSGIQSAPVPGSSGTNGKAIVAGQYKLAIAVAGGEASEIRAALEGIAFANRFIPERDAREMQHLAEEILRRNLSKEMLKTIRAFGTGMVQPILTISGLLPLRYTPPTPVSGHCDDTAVSPADLLLFGIYGLMKTEPVAYAFENYGRLFRNVAPAAKGERSSHGYDRELPFHTDNTCGYLEGAERPLIDPVLGLRSPIPRYLGFVGLRNLDASGRPVATEVLPVARILRRIDSETLVDLERAEYRIEPPTSNNTSPLIGVPLLVIKNGQRFLRISTGDKSVTGLTFRAQHALALLEAAIITAEAEAERVIVAAGNIHVFDNYRVLHRRPAFDPGDLATSRWLRRCYAALNLANGRFADRFHRPNEWA